MTVYAGVFPIAPTTFHPDGSLDLESQLRAVDHLIEAGANGVCLLANFSEQFSLSDAERDAIVDAVLPHVGGRVPVIVTTSHYGARVAAERSARAEAAGAAMVMLMPPYHGASIRVGEDGIRSFFETVAEAIDIPILVQDAPMSGTTMSAAFLADLARTIPNASYFKLESGVVADKLRALIALGGEAVEGPFDGEESITLLPDLDAGATGTMPGGTTVHELRTTLDHWMAGDRRAATAAYGRIAPFIVEEHKVGGLMATKALMAEAGIIASEAPRAPFPELSPAVRERLIARARELDLFVLRDRTSAA